MVRSTAGTTSRPVSLSLSLYFGVHGCTVVVCGGGRVVVSTALVVVVAAAAAEGLAGGGGGGGGGRAGGGVEAAFWWCGRWRRLAGGGCRAFLFFKKFLCQEPAGPPDTPLPRGHDMVLSKGLFAGPNVQRVLSSRQRLGFR